MRRPQVAWIAVALLGLGALLVIAMAFRTVSTDPRNRTVERIIGALDRRGETWGVGSDFEWMARRAHDAIGGTVCLLANGVCAPLDR
jgi:hypothetical protein